MTYTPWGAAQDTRQLAPGIIDYSTASHGGIHLSPERNQAIPDYMRIEDGWYEEDCDWCIVAAIFPEYFLDNYASALDSLKNWHPDAYESLFHLVLKPGESYVKDKQTFDRENAGNFVVTSAWGDWHENIPPGYVGVHAKRNQDGEEGHYLIPQEEYNCKDGLPFVVDPGKYLAIPAIA